VGLVALYRSPRKFRALISVAVLVAAIASVMPQRFWDRMETIGAPEGEREVSAESRLFVWGVGLHMAAEKPMTGVGFNGFQRSFSNYDVTGGSFGFEKAAHSAWFGVLGETGYPGLILFVLIVLLTLSSLYSIRRRTKDVPAMKDARIYAAGMQMSMVAYIVGDTFLAGQYNEMFWHFIGLCVALDRITQSVPPSQALTAKT
jgi:O-antigen ligase